MSRPICGKITVSGDLVACTPLSVGGAGAGDVVDLELAVNGSGQFYVPGSSLMGPLRHWIRRNISNGSRWSERMLGFQKDDRGHASFMVVNDAPVSLPGKLKR